MHMGINHVVIFMTVHARFRAFVRYLLFNLDVHICDVLTLSVQCSATHNPGLR